MEWTYSLRKR